MHQSIRFGARMSMRKIYLIVGLLTSMENFCSRFTIAIHLRWNWSKRLLSVFLSSQGPWYYTVRQSIKCGKLVYHAVFHVDLRFPLGSCQKLGNCRLTVFCL